MTNEEQLKMYQDLIYANESMRVLINDMNNITEAKEIILNLHKLKDINGDVINKNLEKIDFSKIESKIFEKVENQILSSVKKLEKSQQVLEKQSEKLTIGLSAVDDLIYINDMATDVTEIKSYLKKWKTKSIVTIVIASTLIGLFAGVVGNQLNEIITSFYQNKEFEFKKLDDYDGRFIIFNNQVDLSIGKYGEKDYVYVEKVE